MNSRLINLIALCFAGLAVIGFLVSSTPRWAACLCGFVYLALDFFVSLRDGAVSSTFGFQEMLGYRTFRRDETPLLFTLAVIINGVVMAIFFFWFLFLL